MGATAKNIITQISQKVGREGGVNTYQTYDIGAQLQYVSSIINSNNNNLEEQILLGTDAHTVFTQEIYNSDEEVDVPFIKEVWTTNFKINGSTTDYYRLVTTKKRDHKTHYNYSSGTLLINVSPKIFKEKRELYYITNDGTQDTETLVSTKTYTYTYSEEPATSNPIVIISEDIVVE